MIELPEPAQAPEDSSPEDVTPQELLDFVRDVITEEPWLLFMGLLTTVVVGGVFLAFVVFGITRAGHYNPPVVVVTVVLGLVALFALITYVMQPSNDSLGQVVAAAVGALGGALGTAFAERKFQEKELEYMRKAAQRERRHQSEGDSGHAGDGGGESGGGAGDGAVAGRADADAGGGGSGSPRNGRNGAPWVDRDRSAADSEHDD